MISAEDAQKEFLEQLRTSSDPGFEQLRQALQNLSGPDQENVEKAIARFLTSDASFDMAVRQSGINPVQPGPAMSIEKWASQGEGAQPRPRQQTQQPQPVDLHPNMEPTDEG